MLSIATIPKPFVGAIGDIQRNALGSWRALAPDVDIVLLGDELGVREAAAQVGATHVGGLERSAAGTPRLDSAFLRFDDVARHSLRCFVNADVVFLDDFLGALRTIERFADRFLTVGQTRDVPPPAASVGPPGWQLRLRERALASGVLRGAGAIDYFVFPRGLYDGIPAFLVGRAGFDNWLIWRARSLEVPVVDVTEDVVVVHQSHEYAHLPGGKQEAYVGAEAARNVELAGGKGHLYSICDASHRLRNGRVARNPWATFRTGDRVRRARWKLGFDHPA